MSYLASSLTKAQLWTKAEKAARSIPLLRDSALSELASSLTQAQRWEQAETIALSIEEGAQKAKALSHLVIALSRAKLQAQADNLWARVKEATRSLEKDQWEVLALGEIAASLAENQLWTYADDAWDEAVKAVCSIEGEAQINILIRLADTMVKVQCWEQAEKVAHLAESGKWTAEWQVKPLKVLTNAFLALGDHERLLNIVQHSWLKAETRDAAVESLPLAFGFIALKPEIGLAFYEGFKWVDTFLKG